MTDHELEQNLKQLGRTTEPRNSLTSAVMRRIEDVATPEAHSSFGGQRISRAIIRGIAVVFATAACIATVIFVLRSTPAPNPRQPVVVLPQTHPSAAFQDEAFPRLADYQRAYAQSPDAFERLLQRPSSGASHHAEPQLSVGDASRLDSKLYQ
jgi:hypothetical protein